jgi:cellulose synthase/poly-beta-1,6-N-acetylglucosamine synthase-like glycosyltransferase
MRGMRLITAIVSLWYGGVILFLRRGLHRLSCPGCTASTTFSVVIAARNEEENIGACLDSVLDQTMAATDYEVIVVNDRSIDKTAAIARDYASRVSNLRVVEVTEVPDGISPKKHAVLRGVETARHGIVVFTDADCRVPRTWLETVGRYFTDDTGVVQGITTYSPVAGMNRTFWGLQALDFLSHGIIAAAGIGAGLPINSNANNMAVRREAIEKTGYGTKSGVVSGDDDLLLQRIWEDGRWKIRYMTDRQGAVTTLPTATLKGVFEQRKRWGSKTVHYSPGQVVLLGGVFLFYLLIIFNGLIGLFSRRHRSAFRKLIMGKLAGELLLLIPGTRIFNQQALRRYIVPASVLQLPLVVAAVVIGVFGNFSWKGQSFRRSVGA